MADPDISDIQRRMDGALTALKTEFTGLRTGRASVSLLDRVMVDAYGSMMPLAQVGTVNVPEPRMITVKPWDKGTLKAVEKAIREANLGLNPSCDGDLVRIPIPPLTEERRKDFVKIARKHGEECKVAIRKVRHDNLDMLTELKDGGDASEDEIDRAKKKVEDIVGDGVKHVDSLVASKEKDILDI